jgi:uncharacterized caspase-like protein
MRYLGVIFAVFLVVVTWATGAEAEKRVALVIGNGAYTNTVQLTNPGNDVADIAAALRRLNFQVIEGRDLDKRSMERTVRQFAIELPGTDVAVFYYAGHGLQIGGQNFLVPTDAKLSGEGDLDFESVPLALVVKQMEREAKTSLILLDACRDNPLGRNLARSMGTRAAQIGQGLAEVKTGVGILIGFSTQPGSVSLDGTGRNSPYAAALLDHIEVPGKDVSAVLVSVRNDVLKATAGRQVPWEHTSLTGQVILRPEPRLGAGQGKDYDKEMEIAYWNSVRDTKSVAALQAYLDRYPRGTFAGLARAMVADQAQKQGGTSAANITVASKEPAVTPKAQVASGDDPTTLARSLRKELERVGCMADAADGGWDDRTKHALTDFSRHAKVAVATDAPTAAALEAVQTRKGRVCPLKCGKNEVEDDGECVAKVREKREPSRAPRRAEGESGSGGKQKFCWTQEPSGRQSVTPCGR